MILSSYLRVIPISLEQGLAYGLVALGIVAADGGEIVSSSKMPSPLSASQPAA